MKEKLRSKGWEMSPSGETSCLLLSVKGVCVRVCTCTQSSSQHNLREGKVKRNVSFRRIWKPSNELMFRVLGHSLGYQDSHTPPISLAPSIHHEVLPYRTQKPICPSTAGEYLWQESCPWGNVSTQEERQTESLEGGATYAVLLGEASWEEGKKADSQTKPRLGPDLGVKASMGSKVWLGADWGTQQKESCLWGVPPLGSCEDAHPRKNLTG